LALHINYHWEGETVTEFYRESQERALSFIEQTPMWPLVTYGIVNPYGPTLMGFGIIVNEEEDFTELAYYSLNPFQQEVKALGVFDTDTAPIVSVKTALTRYDISVGGTPTVVLPSRNFSNNDTRLFFKALLAGVTDVTRTIDLCRRFIGNPWDRVSEETSSAMESLVGGDEGNNSRSHTDADVDELLNILQSEQHFMEELKAFAFAWNGSIDFQGSSGNKALAETALSHERFTGIIGKILEGGPRSS
jgi:hypothetical protein